MQTGQLRTCAYTKDNGEPLTYPHITGTATLRLYGGSWGDLDLGLVRRLNDLYAAHMRLLFPNVAVEWDNVAGPHALAIRTDEDGPDAHGFRVSDTEKAAIDQLRLRLGLHLGRPVEEREALDRWVTACLWEMEVLEAHLKPEPKGV